MRNSVLVILAVTACAPAAPTFTDADKAAITSQRQQFMAAVNTAEWDKAVAMYADDAVLMMPNMPAVTGKLAIREAFAAYPPVSEFKIYGEEIAGSGDIAVVRGAISYVMMPAGASLAIADTSKSLEVWRRQADGSWKLHWDISNSDRPVEAFVPLPPAK
jgi:ketosteroid isomerase-like protein